MNTALAPSPIAFKASTPDRTPPSKYTSTPRPLTAATTSGNALSYKDAIML